MTTSAELAWAREEFGKAELGSKRRTDRLVKVAGQAAAAPGGHITTVFRESASREGAFRFVENPHVSPRAVAEASHGACAGRADAFPFVYVPLDGTSLNLADWDRSKGFGVVGDRHVGARGLQVMTAIAVSPDGLPLGVAGQRYWARRGRVRKGGRRGGKRDRRQLRHKETYRWLEVCQQVCRQFAAHAPGTIPWFQLDRGGDSWPVLEMALRMAKKHGYALTVRSCVDRRLWNAEDGPRRYLRETLAKTPVRGVKYLQIPAGPRRQDRVAKLEIRSAAVTLDLHDNKNKNNRPVPFHAVLVREVDATPACRDRIEWLLLTTREIHDLSDAEEVIDGYGSRWTIEEFHRTWKSGTCQVETSQLRACDHIERWATILASVAMRIQKLSKLARSEPDVPATVELSQAEVDALIVTSKTTTYRPGDTPTIAEAVTWIAQLGGYTGKSSGGPPGPTVIARGLDRLQLLAEYLEAARQGEP